MRAAPYFPAGVSLLDTGLVPCVEGGATLAELIDWMHRAPVAPGESYLQGDGILGAVVTCPRCGGDYSGIAGDPGHPDLGGCTEREVLCGTCDEGVIPVGEYAERMARPDEWAAREYEPYDGDW